MSNVVFYSQGFAYTFQVLPSGNDRYGKFSLVSVDPMESQPGASARTNKTSVSNIANLS